MANTTLFEVILADLTKTVENLASVDDRPSDKAAKRAISKLTAAHAELKKLARDIDPVKSPQAFFDPTNPEVSSALVAMAMVAQPRQSMASLPPFYGSGIYAIYYNGKRKQYLPISKTEHPIYVGMADPSDGSSTDPFSQGLALFNRLTAHAKNIAKANTTLDVSEFECKYLAVQSGFQSAAEGKLIRYYRPIWNKETKICHGFGKHGDSATTRVNARSPWDTLHPGRGWADKSTSEQSSYANIITKTTKHYLENPPHKTASEAVDHLLSLVRT